jgi:hypothetical protein
MLEPRVLSGTKVQPETREQQGLKDRLATRVLLATLELRARLAIREPPVTRGQ